ncbi:SDR family oxidoreductase [Streptomyces violaceusniger]|uniref:Peroxisomal trans-2-enoyl-CoA reductase n=1 Tax=Streptomyces violaceusniger (strain Tu 4113) TaxID=653045 RepID=G2PGA9_STRV4|nr:SDR family oxidoreductase [Streptomyces violaceusniger]AEM85488.1 hypothetical protein Strvi_5984 [Streptomyces violaceusniger Tu 4113]
MSDDVVVVIGAGGMGQAVARRIGTGRHLLLADHDGYILQATAERLEADLISTPLGQAELNGASGAAIRAASQISPVPRLGTPEDIAAAVDFLLSPAAQFITGTDLLVDGGVTTVTTDPWAKDAQ